MPLSNRQADARAAFEQWASLQAACPRNVASLVENVERSDDYAGLMNTELRGRRVVWKTVAFSGKGRVTFPAVAIEGVDPWSVDADALRERSDHIASCDACAGAGKNTCSTCAGIGNLTCGHCGGQRKQYGYAANGSWRLLNCQSCRGKSEIDCPGCRRGVAICSICEGSGRVQRWIELEWWQRSIANEQPEWIARQFGWDPNPSGDTVLRDADIVLDVDRPHRLTTVDIGTLPPQWLTQLAPVVNPGERVANERLRIARVATHTVQYRLGSDVDQVPLIGNRLLPPVSNPSNALARRASSLRGTRWLLFLIFAVFMLLSLARGMFYWSALTLMSLIACAGVLTSVYGGIAEWTAARRRMHRWMLAAVMCAVVAVALAVAARPRLAHAQSLLAGGDLDAAQRELEALDAAPASAWADLHLARIRGATDVASARAALAGIPRNLPQYATAADAAGRLIVRDTADLVRGRRWNDAAEAILEARTLGVPEAQLAPVVESIRAAGLAAVSEAEVVTNARTRLERRIAAEALLVTWERAAGEWGTPPLIALRTSMADDVAALEKAARRIAP